MPSIYNIYIYNLFGALDIRTVAWEDRQGSSCHSELWLCRMHSMHRTIYSGTCTSFAAGDSRRLASKPGTWCGCGGMFCNESSQSSGRALFAPHALYWQATFASLCRFFSAPGAAVPDFRWPSHKTMLTVHVKICLWHWMVELLLIIQGFALFSTNRWMIESHAYMHVFNMKKFRHYIYIHNGWIRTKYDALCM